MDRTETPTCYLICGFLGAGKTTYSQKLSEETEAIHLNPDEWCMKLFSTEEYEQNWDKCFSKTIEHLWKKAEEYAQNGKSIIFDMGFWTKLSRDEATQRAKAFHGVGLICLKPLFDGIGVGPTFMVSSLLLIPILVCAKHLYKMKLSTFKDLVKG